MKKVRTLLGAEQKVLDGGCRPVFMIMRYKQVVGVVNGCSTPTMRMLIDLNIPKLKKRDD
jgi:hypothetical protein